MHSALAVLLSVFFLTASTCARGVLPHPSRPQPRSFLEPPPSPAQPDDKCTFTLWHRQLYPLSQAKRNYIQINTLIDHANDISINVALSRPAAAFHSYARVSATQAFAIDGLFDGTNLTVRGDDGSDMLRFQSDGVVWTADGAAEERRDAWCEVGAWDDASGVDDGRGGTRERRMECAFPCEEVDMDEEERIEL